MTVLNQTDITKIIDIQDDMETSRAPATQRNIKAYGVKQGFITFYRKSGKYHVYLGEMLIMSNARSVYDYLNRRFGEFDLAKLEAF